MSISTPASASSAVKNSTTVRQMMRFQDHLIPQATPALLRFLSSLAPGLAAGLADRIFTTPTRYAAPVTEVEMLNTGHRFRVPFRGGDLAAWSWGDGPTVLLVHGWAGRGGQLSSFVRPLVDARYSVVLFDAPGHGQSPGRRSSLVDFAESVQTMAKRVGPIHAIVAHSLGAPSSALAMKRSVSAEKLVFLGAPTSARGATQKFGAAMDIPETVLERMRQRIAARYLMRWEDLEMSRLAHGQNAKLLVVHDQDDRDVSVKNAELISQVWPGGSETLITEGLGHRKILRAPLVIDRVVGFIRS